jgi:hypothetical protein
MKHRKTSLDPVADKPESQDPMARPPTTHPRGEARLGREVQARIGQQLRAMYNDVVNQGVPQHLAELVRRLSDQDQD